MQSASNGPSSSSLCFIGHPSSRLLSSCQFRLCGSNWPCSRRCRPTCCAIPAGRGRMPRGWPATTGMGFKSPEFQCGAMHYLVRAVVRRDERCTGRRLECDRRHVPLSERAGRFRPGRRPARRPFGRGLLAGRTRSGRSGAARKRVWAEVQGADRTARAEDSQGRPLACPAALSGRT